MDYSELQSWLTDVRYALSQLGGGGHMSVDRAQRAWEALKRVEDGIETERVRLLKRNIAADLEINKLLVEAGFTLPPDTPTGLTVEQYYALLEKK